MEIGWTLEWKRYSGGRRNRTDLLEIHHWSISNTPSLTQSTPIGDGHQFLCLVTSHTDEYTLNTTLSHMFIYLTCREEFIKQIHTSWVLYSGTTLSNNDSYHIKWLVDGWDVECYRWNITENCTHDELGSTWSNKNKENEHMQQCEYLWQNISRSWNILSTRALLLLTRSSPTT